MTTNPNEIEAARSELGIGKDNMLADDWLIKQLAAWPLRVDPQCTTNLRFLMESAALSLHLSAASARGAAEGDCPACGGGGRVGPFFPGGISAKCGNCAAPSSPAATPQVVDALPKHIGRLHLGERFSNGERLCAEGHDIPAGHPMYWPEQIGQYDDSDPCCLEHAIDLTESDQGWCPCRIAAATPDVEAIARIILDAIHQYGNDDGFTALDLANDAAAEILALSTPPAPAGEGNPDANDMAEADAEVERILAMSDEEVMEGVTPEEIAKMRRDIDRLSRTFAAGRRSGFIAGRDAAAGHLDAKANEMRGTVTGDMMARIFEEQATAIRAIEPGEMGE